MSMREKGELRKGREGKNIMCGEKSEGYEGGGK